VIYSFIVFNNPEIFMQHTLSNKALLQATLIALVIAAAVLVSVILPAEYNIDPTGLGAKLGLTALANTDSSMNTNAGDAAENTKIDATDIMQIIVPANRGIEYKFAMQQFKKMTYQWQTDGTALFFDLHGEPEGDTSGYYESYAIATVNEMQGSFTTPFAGIHGWYWKNTSDQEVTIKLTVSGEYTVIGLKK
jgi:hypothetical protein